MADWQFEEISENDVTSVKRGRKSNVDPGLLAALKTLKAGKAIRIVGAKLDPKANTYKTDKARVSASLRSACRAAGHENFSIAFTPDGIPQVVIKK